ncbi:MAG: hypothetical protein IPK32_23565 [Verrucomicrobiaceae bacterium]|nr:hypothetical protein [Verrucomicrobiaceae bacterium]
MINNHARRAALPHDAHDYAKRIGERLPRSLLELRERGGLSKCGLARKNGISREYIGKLEYGFTSAVEVTMPHLTLGTK